MKIKSHIYLFTIIAFFMSVITVVKYFILQLGDSPWNRFIYFYGLGCPIYFSCCWLLIRTKAISLRNKKDRTALLVMTCGATLFFMIHALWIWSSIHSIYEGV